MKKFGIILIVAISVVAFAASSSLAHCGSCGVGDKPAKTDHKHASDKAHKHAHDVKAAAKSAVPGEMGECCIKAAKAGKGCCGKDAEAVKANFASYTAEKAAMADMHKCCAEAMTAGKGCCGHSAEELKADFTTKVSHHKAAMAVKADMHECCAKALDEGKGCCGKDAKELKATFDKKVKAAEKKMASM